MVERFQRQRQIINRPPSIQFAVGHNRLKKQIFYCHKHKQYMDFDKHHSGPRSIQ